MRSRRLTDTAIALCLPLLAASVVAGSLGATTSSARAGDEVSTDARGRVLHRRLPPPPGQAGSAPVFVYDPRQGSELPREVQRDGQVLPMPAGGTEPEDGEAVYSAEGLTSGDPSSATPEASTGTAAPTPSAAAEPPATGEPAVDPRGTLGDEALPDRDTDMEGTLGYHAVFDPSIVPFKRNRALGRVNVHGALQIAGGRLRAVPTIGNRVGADREVFWGSILVQAAAGDTIPLPSVAPDSRILSYEATPAARVNFLADDDDNFYMRLEPTPGEAQQARKIRLVFLMDAPKAYFARPMPRGARLSQVPAAMRPTLPPSMQAPARDVIRALGLEGERDLVRALNRLVSHFRSFEPGEPPPDTGDTYRDLALGKRGICRHRGYGFVVTAHALGIPARYVFNEAHVFVEAWIPGEDQGWVRIDLGGGAERLVVQGADDKIRHRPSGRDPFDRPSEYADANAAGATEVTGLPPAARPDRSVSSGTGAGRLRRSMLPPPAMRAAARAGATPTSTELLVGDSLVYRGEPITVTGHVVDRRGRPVKTGDVQILLLDAGSGEALGLLRMTRLDATGRFETTITFPEDQTPGGYELVAEFLGTAALAPSRSP